MHECMYKRWVHVLWKNNNLSWPRWSYIRIAWKFSLEQIRNIRIAMQEATISFLKTVYAGLNVPPDSLSNSWLMFLFVIKMFIIISALQINTTTGWQLCVTHACLYIRACVVADERRQNKTHSHWLVPSSGRRCARSSCPQGSQVRPKCHTWAADCHLKQKDIIYNLPLAASKRRKSLSIRVGMRRECLR